VFIPVRLPLRKNRGNQAYITVLETRDSGEAKAGEGRAAAPGTELQGGGAAGQQKISYLKKLNGEGINKFQ